MKLESNVNRYALSFPTEFKYARLESLTDIKGKEYLDFFSGAGTLNYGHNNPILKEKLIDFIISDRPVHCLDMDTTMKREFLEAFKKIILDQRSLDYKVMFPGPTGTNAVEASVRLARKITGRKKIISFSNSFHGMTATSLGLSASQTSKWENIPSQDVIFFPFDGFLGPLTNSLEYFEKMVATKGSGISRPAAIIVETIQAEGGINIASNQWLRELAEIAKRNEIILIVDDIQVGCGRSGKFFSFEWSGIIPDIVLLSKSISGYGLPLSLVLIKPELDVWKPGEHNGTFRSNNLALRTATCALDFWKDKNFENEIADKSKLISDSLHSIVSGNLKITAVRGKGLIWGIEFSDEHYCKEAAQQLFESGLIIETCGNRGQVLKLLPPLIISPSKLLKGLEMIRNCVSKKLQPQLTK